ncbi:ABC transporter ATP-binding protein [Zobellella iuensis]|uniref:ABC-type dipeptide transporter n=1 Tax=Zobellella iuensis TaxID=2803811 RepID=A0ABS1QNV4_9GAMM|nr:ABC transporter ATP-binding protein [Zobellella iuensis]MBL1376539.1 ABC transporter ATP-binding protein [Zobellella iuensis]
MANGSNNSGEVVLQVEDLCIEFSHRKGNLKAIQQVSFEMRAGEILGVVGESGAGKSLTGSAITGLLEPPGRIASGQIRLHGQRIDDLDEEERRLLRGKEIGAIFQDPLTSLNPVMTVGKQLIETIQTHLPLSYQAARDKALKLMQEVGIPAAEQRIDQYPHQFSGGMRQRIVIALALCVEPKVIIADEPTTALDVSVQAQVLQLLRRLCKQHQASVMLVTHDMGVIAEICDRVAVMYAGRLVEIGPVEAVLKAPSHPYTVGLMASIPRIGVREPRLSQIPGAMPRLNAIPPGCAFNPRCPHSGAECRQQSPVLERVGDSRVACLKVKQEELA